jgi:hypothetical protein
MGKHRAKTVRAPNHPLGIGRVALVLLALIFLAVLVRIGVRYEIGRIHDRAVQALSTLKMKPRTRIRDAEGMLPTRIGRDYRIQAELQPELKQVEQAYSTLLSKIKHAGSDPAEGLPYSRTIQIFDLCTLYRDDDHDLVQTWIAKNAYAFPETLYQHLVRNYFEVAMASEEAGDISEAKVSYAHFLKLMHLVCSVSDLALYIKVQRELTKAEIRVAILSPQHFFNSPALGDFNRENQSFQSEVHNVDPAIRGLAILSLAAKKYHEDDYPAAVAFLQQDDYDCGPLQAECLFLGFKAQAREAESALTQGVKDQKWRDQLQRAGDGFGKMLITLPEEHYLRPECLLWMALTQDWIGNRSASNDMLRRTIASFPESDVARIARDALLGAGEVKFE